jgi:hypothetical protein
MIRVFWRALLGTMVLMAMQQPALPADMPAAVPGPYQPAPAGWRFTVAPYIWATGIEGTSGLFGLPPQDIEASFSDILENLDGALMIAGEARYDRYSFGLDLMYSKIGASVDTPFGIVADSIDVTNTMFVATGVAGYAVYQTEAANIDLFAGGRLWTTDTDFEFNGGVFDDRSPSDGATWVDPIIGSKFRAALGESSFSLSGWAMLGGFGVSSDFMWDVMGGLGYEITESASVFAGYRALGVDYESDGFVLDVTQQGPVLGGVFRF